jgi:general secretion pathway protein G
MSFITRTQRRRAPRASGFTLLEIMVVLAILGLLVGLAVSNLDKIFGGAQTDIARTFVNSSMKTPLMAYRMDMGGFPSTAEGLQALVVAPQGRADRWRGGPYISDGKIPLDPWGEPYQYAFPGKHNPNGYDLWSKGPDKQDGTADDIGNWTVSESAPGK